MAVSAHPTLRLKVGDAVWIATAVLHQRYPSQPDFDLAEIVNEVKCLGLTDKEDSSIYVHANQHCVATRPPNPAKLRMLFETQNGRRRLLCQGDKVHHERDGRMTPRAVDLPEPYRPLLDWYNGWSTEHRHGGAVQDSLLALRGSGRELWMDEHADVYIDNLRREHL